MNEAKNLFVAPGFAVDLNKVEAVYAAEGDAAFLCFRVIISGGHIALISELDARDLILALSSNEREMK